MKKLFTYLSVAMLAVAAVSCQKEMAVEDGGQGNVTISIQTPEVATKDIADGMNVNIVHYEIYKNETGHKNSIDGGTALIKGTVPMEAKGASLTLNLLQGQSYVGLFWAQVDGQSYYDVTDLREVKVAYPNEDTNKTYANDEARAAFCQKKVFSTGKNVSVVLERPFAQINLGTTIADLTDDYTITLEQSSMTVKGVAKSFNVAAMTAGETEVNVEFSYATLPYVFNPSETLVANNQTWAYAGMNYVLVPGDAATVDVTYSIKTDVGTVTRNVPVVPVQKNYRTNLLGNLLTQETAIEIVVDERFADYEDKYEGGKYGEIDGQIYVKVESAEELVDAVADPNVDMVILVDDITVESQIQIYKNLVLDLNGKTLTAAKDGAEVDAIWVRDNAEVVITGNGTINATYDAVFATGTSKLTIENGTFIGVAEAVFAQANAQVVINGGTFKSTQYPEFTLNLRDKTGKGENDTATITVYGGTFYQFNPADNAAEGVGTNFVNENCSVIVDGDYYKVVLTTVSTAEELKNAFAVASEIKLANDIDLTNVEWTPIGTAEEPFSGTFDGQGHKITGLKIEGSKQAGFIAYAGENTTIKNVIFENVSINSTKYAGGVVCSANNVGLVLSNIEISGSIYGKDYAGGIIMDAANITIENCVDRAEISSNYAAGGIAAWLEGNETRVSNVENYGNITANTTAAGISNRFAGELTNAINFGTITGNGSMPAGGVVAVQLADSKYSYCYNNGNVTSTADDANASASGILGHTSTKAELSYCANYGAVTAEQSYAAGIAYSLYGTLNASYCYNDGAVVGADGAGAIAPKAQYGAGDKASYCLNAGAITSANGVVYQGSNNNTYCFYYDDNELINVSGNVTVNVDDALVVLNGGTDAEFFTKENGKIVVK